LLFSVIYHLTLAYGCHCVAEFVQGGSNMTGTDLCVNKPQSVPVIFEPPCILLVQIHGDYEMALRELMVHFRLLKVCHSVGGKCSNHCAL